MHYCNVPLAPLRLTPSHRSEMVSQLLFGEQVQVTTIEGEWSQVKVVFDNYIAYIESRHIELVTRNFTADTMLLERAALATNAQQQVLLPKGALLPNYNNGTFLFNGQAFTCNAAVRKLSTTIGTYSALKAFALDYLNTPYLWGGRSTFGIDCSGFTQQVYRYVGINLLRDAAQQAEQGSLIDSIAHVIPGDLLFFDNQQNKIIHVGVLLENRQILHSSGHVRIDHVDEKGIRNAVTETYTHHLCLIKRHPLQP